MNSQLDFLEILSVHALEVAPRLLGCILKKGNLSAKIVEVEAYRGKDDLGSHAARSRTPRNEIMFGKPGFAYVYFTYGSHWMLNMVVEDEGQPAAILIRAAQPLSGIDEMHENRPKAKSEIDLLSGPAKLTQAFGITKQENGIFLLDSKSQLQLELAEPVQHVITSTRIGLSEGRGENLPWRFMDAESMPWVSKPHPKLGT